MVSGQNLDVGHKPEHRTRTITERNSRGRSSFRSLAFKGFPDGHSTGGCVCVRLRTEDPNPRSFFCERGLTGTRRRHHLDGGRRSPTYPPSPSLSSFGAASVVMCCSARPASSSAPSVLPVDRIGRNIIYAALFCDHINVLHIFDQICIVLKLGWRSTKARLIVML